MSREIKFRIWDDSKKEWLGESDNDSLTFYGFHLVGEVMTVQCPPQWALDECCTVEQYTGLTDKNGKEIYEGDIVKTNSPDRANFNAGAIVMQQQMYLIINTPTYGDARLSHSEPLGYYCDMECEVIGNIHENGDLLGGGE